MLNENATLDNVRKSFVEMSKVVDRNDRFFVYWAGHGETESTGSGKDVGYLFPFNGEKNALAQTCISIDEIYRITDKINAAQVLFMIDACVGGLKNVKNASWKCLQILTSGSKGELLVENKQWKHSAFGKLLIEQFKKAQETPNQYVILLPSKLHEYISPRVTEMSQQGAYKGQHPQLVTFGNCQTPFFYNRDDKMYSLQIIDIPESSKVFINGRLVANGKYEYVQNVFSGNYKIEVESPGRQKYVTTVKVNRDVVVRPNLPKILNYTLESTPSGANVFIDGKNVGVTPLTTKLSAGEHSIVVSKDGFDTLSFTTIMTDKDKSEKVVLQKQRIYELTIKKLPTDNLLFINGKQYVSDSSIFKIKLPFGKYVVRVESPGVHRFGTSFLLENDTTITPEFVPLVNYTIKSEPESVNVSIDNEHIGMTPLTTFITEGEHKLSLSKEFYDSISYNINVSKGNSLFSATVRKSSVKDSVPFFVGSQNNQINDDSINVFDIDIKVKEFDFSSDSMAHLEIVITPSDAYIYIDGERIQTSLGKAKVNVLPGEKNIFVDYDGFESYSYTEILQSKETKQISIELVPSKPISKWWIWGSVGALVAGGSTYLILINQPEKVKETNPYGAPPGFPIDP